MRRHQSETEAGFLKIILVNCLNNVLIDRTPLLCVISEIFIKFLTLVGFVGSLAGDLDTRDV